MARAGRAERARSRRETSADRTSALASRLAREPQIAALEAVAEWAEQQGVPPRSVDGMRDVIAVFAADSDAPNLDLVMRARRCRIVQELRGSASARSSATVWR